MENYYYLSASTKAILRYIAERHKVTAKINTVHNASVCKQPPNANLRLGSCPLERTRLIAERALTDVTLTGLLGIGQF